MATPPHSADPSDGQEIDPVPQFPMRTYEPPPDGQEIDPAPSQEIPMRTYEPPPDGSVKPKISLQQVYFTKGHISFAIGCMVQLC